MIIVSRAWRADLKALPSLEGRPSLWQREVGAAGALGRSIVVASHLSFHQATVTAMGCNFNLTQTGPQQLHSDSHYTGPPLNLNFL
jgi:hypothetical protein